MIRGSKITEPITLTMFQAGMKVESTLLGKAIAQTAHELGGRVVDWDKGLDKYGRPWAQATLDYSQPAS